MRSCGGMIARSTKNAGEGAVRHVLHKHGKLPNWIG